METFVVQIWPPAENTNTAHGEIRGFVEHVGSGRRGSFRKAADLLAFFESQQPHQPPNRDTKEDELR